MRNIALLAVLLLALAPARATWSILLVDTRTREIAVGSATCLTSFDLRAWTPVLRVGVGAATAQSVIDSGAVNRMRIWNELAAGTPLPQILAALAAQDPSHQSRQYGMVDAAGGTLTFSGAGTAAWAGGVTGQIGTVHYAIQGNILTGAPVVAMAEQAVLTTPGDLAAKLMAAMEAARAMGGDGRCSCSPGAPTSCGAPPAVFTKSAHIGYVLIARQGDTDGTCTSGPGCATGSYYLALNVAFQSVASLDPVLQLQQLFAPWRATWVGRPDHHLSAVSLPTSSLPADGAAMTTATITVRDWQGTVLAAGGHTVTPSLDPASTAAVSFGAVTDHGNGSYSVPVTAGTTLGEAWLRFTVADGQGTVLLSPATPLLLLPCACADCDARGGPADVLDALTAAQITVGLTTATPAKQVCCDIDGSLTINVLDAFQIASHAATLPVVLGCP